MATHEWEIEYWTTPEIREGETEVCPDDCPNITEHFPTRHKALQRARQLVKNPKNFNLYWYVVRGCAIDKTTGEELTDFPTFEINQFQEGQNDDTHNPQSIRHQELQHGRCFEGADHE